jgi:hypothetical protein
MKSAGERSSGSFSVTAVSAEADNSVSSNGQAAGVDDRVSLQSRRRFRSAKNQRPSILANLSR